MTKPLAHRSHFGPMTEAQQLFDAMLRGIPSRDLAAVSEPSLARPLFPLAMDLKRSVHALAVDLERHYQVLYEILKVWRWGNLGVLWAMPFPRSVLPVSRPLFVASSCEFQS